MSLRLASVSPRPTTASYPNSPCPWTATTPGLFPLVSPRGISRYTGSGGKTATVLAYAELTPTADMTVNGSVTMTFGFPAGTPFTANTLKQDARRFVIATVLLGEFGFGGNETPFTCGF